ncbi:MAG: rRNA maturation RNase YbeY [Clostridia bacterium]|nr:rRNA maturation RNase YbeY [Clostridia bacterium]
MELYVQNQQDKLLVAPELEELLRSAMEITLREEGYNTGVQGEAGIVLVSNESIRQLNRTYRGQDQATDVLSFSLSGTEDDPYPILGEVIISVERAAEQAQELGHSLERELAFLAVHGTLHLLGYDHETEEEAARMRAKEKAILDECMNNK